MNVHIERLWNLAYIAPSEGSRERLLVLCGVLIALCIAGGVVILLLRRRLFSNASDQAESASLMEQLRSMRDRGEMSPEEFEQTRQAMIRKLKNPPEQGKSRLKSGK